MRGTQQPAAGPANDCLQAFRGEIDYVLRVLRRHGARPADAEDLAQEVFLVLWRRWADFRSDRPLRPWLAGIAVNLAMRQKDRYRREVELSGTEMRDEAPLPDARLAAAHARALVERALERLPERHRLPVILRDLEEIPVRELADSWSVPLFTAYTRIRVARRAFAEAVARLQRGAAPGQRPWTAAALIALERQQSPVPPDSRVRVLARLRALLLLPAERWPQPAAELEPPAPGASWSPVAFTGAGVAALGLMVLVLGSWTAGPTPAVASGAPAAVSAVVRTVPRAQMPPPRLIAASLPAAPDPVPDTRALAGAPEPLARGLAGRWRFDDERGSALASDSSGLGRPCELQGLDVMKAWRQGRRDGALRFSRWARLECPLPETEHAPASELTVAAWVQPDRFAPRQSIAARDSEAGRDLFSFTLRERELSLTSSVWRVRISRLFPVPPKTAWVHVAFTHAADGTIKLYIDGVPVATARSRQRAPVRALGPLRVGAGVDRPTGPRPGRNEEQFAGAIDDLLIYDRALSDEEIARLR